jgi:hypothetical protein
VRKKERERADPDLTQTDSKTQDQKPQDASEEKERERADPDHIN